MNKRQHWFVVCGKITKHHPYYGNPKETKRVEDANVGVPFGTQYYTRWEAETYAKQLHINLDKKWNVEVVKKSIKRQ